MTQTLTTDYKRTLAVIGRFNSDPNTPVLVFDSNDRKATGNLSAADVWEKLKPELGQTAGGDLSCGGFAFTHLSLSRPVAGERDTARPVPLDSMLLEQASSPVKTQQTVGGELVVALLRDLDVVARFAGHRFPEALLEVARRYLNVDARLKSGNLIGDNQIDRLVADPLYADAIVRVLTAYEADLSLAEREFRRALSKGALGEGVSPLQATDRTERNKMVDAIVASLRKLRLEVLGAGSEPDDKSWRKIMGIEPADEGTATSMVWANDMNSHGEYGFDIGIVKGLHYGRTLVDYYNLYMEHSANLHRFVRSPILHSHVFLWLMSKYEQIVDGDSRKAAEKAYEMGVAGAGIDRILGESSEKVEERRKGIFQGSEELIKEIEADLKPKESEFLKQLREYQAMLNEAVFSHVFRDSRRFSREELLVMLENLFAGVVDVTSGKVGDILRDAIDFGMEYRSLYQRLLGILASGDDQAVIRAEIGKLAKAEDNERRRSALEKVAAVLANTGDDEERLREVGLETFSHQVGHSVTGKFIKECLASRTELESSTQKNRDLYFLASILGGRVGKVHERAAESVLAPMSGDSERAEDAETAVRKKVEINATSVAKSGASVAVPLSEGLKAAFGEARRGVEYDIRVKPTTTAEEDADPKPKLAKRVGTVKVTSREQRINIDEEIVYELADGDVPELEFELVSNDADGADASGGNGKEDAETEELEIPDVDKEEALGEVRRILEDGRKRYARARTVDRHVGELSTYAGLREQLRLLSANVDKSDLDEVVRTIAQRRLFALSFGEIIAAAPDNESFLGKQDISQTLALMLEVVKELGNRENKHLVNAEPDDESDKALGPREKGGPRPTLNLSRFFRVPDDKREGTKVIQNAINYHQTLCESVQQVKDHLEDMRDLRVIADGMPSDTRLVVINRTLDEYANEVSDRVGEWHFSLNFHPSVVYFPKCAEVDKIADSDSSQSRGGESAWGLLEKTFKQNLFMVTDDGPVVPSCPMIVTANQMNDVVDACPFPAMRLRALGDIGFRARPGGGTLETESVRGSSKQKPIKFETMGLLVEGSGYLLSMPAAMAFAVFAENEGILGKLSGDVASFQFVDEFSKITGLKFREKERVLSLLRRFWVDARDGESCLSEFILARLSSLMIRWMVDNQGSDEQEKPFIRKFLQDTQLTAPAAGVNEDPAIGEAQRDFLEASFWPATPFTDITFHDDKGANTDITKVDTNCKVFGSNCSKKVICVLTGVDGQGRREIELPQRSRQKLGFLYQQ